MRALVVILLAASTAHADDEIVRGAVVKVEASEIYVNLGRDRAVADGAALRIKRTIKLQHPVTRAAIEDWVPVGSAVVTQAGGQLSRAVVGSLVDEIRVGDVAEVLVDRPDKPPPPAQPLVPSQPGAPPVDPSTVDVVTAFTTQTGQPLDVRIAAWERFLSTHPNSPYAAAIRSDIDTLGGLREQMRPPSPTSVTEIDVKLAHATPERAPLGSPIALVFVIDHPERVASAYLHYRVATDRTYRRLLLAREHDIYLRGTLPPAAVQPPGVDYFVEVSAPTGSGGVALGSPTRPLHVDVAEATVADRFGPRPGRSAVRITAEAIDFATFDKRDGNRRDRLVDAMVDFTYRIDHVVETIGVGYGVFDGQGGFANRVYSDAEPVPRSAFQFGYADLECGLVQEGVHVSVGGKLIAGVGKDGFGLGAEGRVRLGHRDGANLMVVGRTIEQVGFIADIKFGARPTSDLGLGISVGATDQPSGGDVGVKLGSELEYFASPNVSLLLRASWQGRTTEHGGIGGGAGVGFQW